MRDVNENLGSQLTAATQMAGHLKSMLAEGDGVIRRLSKIAIAARPSQEAEPRRHPGLYRQGGSRGGRSILRTQKGQWPRRMKSFRDIRVIPVVLVAIFGLAVLKIAGLVIDGGYVFDYQVSQPAKRSWAQDNLGYPSSAKADPADITGSVKKEEKKEEPKPPRPRPKRRSRTASWCFPTRTRNRCRRRSAPSWNGCRRGARNWSSARVKSKSAKAF